MTEEAWLASMDLKAMLTFLKGHVSDRKLPLFACACGRHHLDRKHDERDRRILEAEERYADGVANIETVVAAYEAAGNDPVDARDLAHFDPYMIAYYTGSEYEDSLGAIPEEVRRLHCGLLRDIVNPFRPAAVSRSWGDRNESAVLRMARSICGLLCDIIGNSFRRSTVSRCRLVRNKTTVLRMAQSIYEDRAFDRMPELADALVDAGCHDAEILGHCRQAGPHARGCWVIDLILDKS
jgi:hypothetical protein